MNSDRYRKTEKTPKTNKQTNKQKNTQKDRNLVLHKNR